MGFVIAMAGKGGTGKTTIAALIVRLIKENKLGSILAVDADPNSNLAESLGLEFKETIGGILDDIAAHPDKVPAGMPKDAFIEYRIQTAIAEGDGFDLLTMGRPEGPGCYCYVNNALRGVMAKLIADYKYIVIDNEAGLEHLSRRITRSADSLVVVSDASKVGLRSAQRIAELVRELKIKTGRQLLIVNRMDSKASVAGAQVLGLEYLCSIPQDEGIAAISLDGTSLFNLNKGALSLETLRKSGDKIWQRN